jgi:hypothetical protein
MMMIPPVTVVPTPAITQPKAWRRDATVADGDDDDDDDADWDG